MHHLGVLRTLPLNNKKMCSVFTQLKKHEFCVCRLRALDNEQYTF